MSWRTGDLVGLAGVRGLDSFNPLVHAPNDVLLDGFFRVGGNMKALFVVFAHLMAGSRAPVSASSGLVFPKASSLVDDY